MFVYILRNRFDGAGFNEIVTADLNDIANEFSHLEGGLHWKDEDGIPQPLEKIKDYPDEALKIFRLYWDEEPTYYMIEKWRV